MWGSRSSLFVGFTVGLAATAIGMLVGLASGFFGRRIDNSLSLTTNVFLLIPGLPLLVVLAAFLPPGIGTVILVLTITGWAGSARVLRSQALSIRGKDFVAASIVTGERPLRVMFREMLPNMASLVMITLIGSVIYGIGAQAGLEFLGSATRASSAGVPTCTGPPTTAHWHPATGGCSSPRDCASPSSRSLFPSSTTRVDEVSNPRLRSSRRRRTSPIAATEVSRMNNTDAISNTESAPVLEVTDLCVEYRGENRSVRAVDRVSFTIGSSEIFGLAGESGCGKSTVANAIMRLLRDPGGDRRRFHPVQGPRRTGHGSGGTREVPVARRGHGLPIGHELAQPGQHHRGSDRRHLHHP